MPTAKDDLSHAKAEGIHRTGSGAQRAFGWNVDSICHKRSVDNIDLVVLCLCQLLSAGWPLGGVHRHSGAGREV